MGKAARNEKRKLRAVYFNNLASGLTLTGIILPLLTAGPVFSRFKGMISSQGTTVLSPDDLHLVGTLGAAVVSMAVAYVCRWGADTTLSGIED